MGEPQPVPDQVKGQCIVCEKVDKFLYKGTRYKCHQGTEEHQKAHNKMCFHCASGIDDLDCPIHLEQVYIDFNRYAIVPTLDGECDEESYVLRGNNNHNKTAAYTDTVQTHKQFPPVSQTSSGVVSGKPEFPPISQAPRHSSSHKEKFPPGSQVPSGITSKKTEFPPISQSQMDGSPDQQMHQFSMNRMKPLPPPPLRQSTGMEPPPPPMRNSSLKDSPPPPLRQSTGMEPPPPPLRNSSLKDSPPPQLRQGTGMEPPPPPLRNSLLKEPPTPPLRHSSLKDSPPPPLRQGMRTDPYPPPLMQGLTMNPYPPPLQQGTGDHPNQQVMNSTGPYQQMYPFNQGISGIPNQQMYPNQQIIYGGGSDHRPYPFDLTKGQNDASKGNDVQPGEISPHGASSKEPKKKKKGIAKLLEKLSPKQFKPFT